MPLVGIEIVKEDILEEMLPTPFTTEPVSLDTLFEEEDENSDSQNQQKHVTTSN